jgi:hypothetical protein
VSARAEVANTIAYRRRKGTASVLEQLARDVTGWNARVVEFFQRLETSQYMNHIRLENRVTASMRDWEALERRGTAFNTLAHSVDMRRIESQKGRYNIPNVGLFLWRLDAFSLTQSPAVRLDDQRFLFSPLGNDMQLFTRPESETDITHLAEPINVPEPISRRVLHRDLTEHVGKENSLYYGQGRSLVIEVDSIKVGIDGIHVCNLADDGSSWANLSQATDKIAIDPVLGRIAFPAGTAPQNVRATFHHGFSMAIGGGEYERRSSFALAGGITPVSQGEGLQDALAGAQTGGIVEIADSGRYEGTLSMAVTATAKVEVRAANERRPTIVLGSDWNIVLDPEVELTLNGLLITGKRLHVTASGGKGPRIFRLRHCTLVPGLTLMRTGEPEFPGEPSLVIEAPGATVEIDHCIVGGVRAGRETTVKFTDSIVDATEDGQVAFSAGNGVAAGGVLSLVNSTVIGRVHTARLDLASNAIFLAERGQGSTWKHPVISDQNQQGCVRFSVLPLNSIVPRRYRCQPDLAVTAALTAADVPKGSLNNVKRNAITVATQARVRPEFTTLRYGQPGYCQLGSYCAKEIRTGAEDESEMGAFHDVFAPQREGNLTIRLQEYLRFGLEAGIFYAT